MFLLTSFVISAQSNQVQILDQDGCCVRVYFESGALTSGMTLSMGDGTTFTTSSPEVSSQGQGFVVSYCYDDNGPYQIRMINATGGGALVNVFISGCEPVNCTSWLCWEDFIGHFQCAQYIIVELPDGSTQTITIGNIPVNGNGNPQGGFAPIAAALQSAMQSVNYGGQFSPTGDCVKANEAGVSPTPGFYFLNSSVKILQVCGGPCDINNGGVSACEPFNNSCD